MKSILVVEDEHDILLTIELILDPEGYHVVKAANGVEALARLAETKPALVIMDVMMPVQNGLDTLLIMRADPDYKNVPVLLMSAAKVQVDQKKFGWTDFLRKPFEIDQLLESVARLAGAP
jgi:two-component system phosphate regulon response regulator PhoB